MQAPTASELLNHPVVRQALDQVWADSLPHDAAQRHEEGGWVYMDTTSGELTIRRAQGGGQAIIDLANPPVVLGSLVVGKFHTHPNPTAEGWNPGPSEGDLLTDALHGVPDLIRAENDVYFSGPDQRRGGLIGRPGYPV